MNCRRRCQQTQFSSTVQFRVTRWSWSWCCHHFLSLIFKCRCVFYFRFSSLLPLSKFWYHSFIHWQTRHTRLFLIPCLGSCPLSTNQKILLTSLAKYTISGQSDTEIDLFQIYTGSFGFGFKLNIFIFRKSMQILFTDRALPTIRCMDQILGGKSITVASSRPKFMVAYVFILSWFHPSLTGLTWLSSVEWCSGHQCAITCLIGVVFLCTVTQWCG